MTKEIENLRAEFNLELQKNLDQASRSQDSRDRAVFEKIRIKYLGRKSGLLTKLFEWLKELPLEQKKKLGPVLNSLRNDIETGLLKLQKNFDGSAADLDFTLPPSRPLCGHYHPVTLIQKQLEEIFWGLGFDVELGPEIESDFYNFEALNIPEHHPARDMQDTFYVDLDPPKGAGKSLVLRTHVSNMQVRYMQKHKPPFAVVLPGRVYRNESVDASHEHTYQYMEGFVVGDKVNFANMKWTLDYALKQIFGSEIKTKLLPSYFPFVEPGAEMAMSCTICKGAGCSVCKHTGWVEILGCGMIHQRVLEYGGYKKNQYQGFAFGGLSRLGLLKYGINDIRLLAENDLRFLEQF